MIQEPSLALVGATIADKYKILSKLSEGGMGQVYLAEHVDLKELRAVKVVSLESELSDVLKQRFINEIKVTHRVCQNNPHIVRIYDTFGFEKSYGYYVMEYLEGDLLSHRIDDNPGRLPISWCAQVAIDVCSAMQSAHQEGIVHRDLKPDNIFLVDAKGRSDFVKIVDFGIAQLETSDQRLTRTGAIVGTILYLSPEQIVTGSPGKESRPITHRSDIYALGCILYEMLIGEAPFSAEGQLSPIAVNEILMSHLMQPPPSMCAQRPDIPKTLEQIVFRAMAKAPEERFSSMKAFARALQFFVDDPAQELLPLSAFDDDEEETKIEAIGASYQATASYSHQGDASAQDAEIDTDETDYGPTDEITPAPELVGPSTRPTPQPQGPRAVMAPTQPSPPPHPLPTADTRGGARRRSAVKLWLGGALLAMAVGFASFFALRTPPAKRAPTATSQAPKIPKFLRDLKAAYAAGAKLYSKAEATNDDALFLRAAARWKQMLQTQQWQQSPYFPSLYLGIGRAYLKARHLHLSRKYYGRYVNASPPQDQAALALRQRRLPKLKAAIQSNRKRAQPIVASMAKALQQGRFRLALKAYSAALRLGPSQPQLHLQVAQKISPYFPGLSLQLLHRALRDLEPGQRTTATIQKQLAQLTARRKQEANKRQRTLQSIDKWLDRDAFSKARKAIVTLLRSARKRTRFQAGYHSAIERWLHYLIAQAPTQGTYVLRAYHRLLKHMEQKGLLAWQRRSQPKLPQAGSFPKQLQLVRQITTLKARLRRVQQALKRGQLTNALALMPALRRLWVKLKAQDQWTYLRAYKSPLRTLLASQRRLRAALAHDKSARSHIAHARFSLARHALQQAIQQLKGTPSYAARLLQYRQYKQQIQKGQLALKQGKAAYKRGLAHNRKSDWKRARHLLGAYLKRFPQAWNRAQIKKLHNAAGCELHIPWAFCSKHRNKPGTR